MVASAQGEDRSNYQAIVPWTDDSFGFCKATEDLSFTDGTFAGNWANLKAEGKYRGAYHYFHPGTDAVAQAQFFVSTVKAQGLEPGDMLMIDFEILSGAPLRSPARNHVPVSAADQAMTVSGVDGAVLSFLNEVNALAGPGHPIVVYTNHECGQYVPATAAAYPVLFFAWPSATAPPASLIAPWRNWYFWQWAFGGGEGGGDRDAFNGTVPDLEAFINSYKPRYRIELVHIVTNGKESLSQVCSVSPYNTPAVIIELALQHYPNHDFYEGLGAYVSRGDWAAPLPAHMDLWRYEEVLAAVDEPLIRFRAGRKPNDPALARVRMDAHLDGVSYPASCDYYSRVASWGMLGNDEWGDCTCACDGHIVEQQTAFGMGLEKVVTTGQCLTAYEAIGGFDPNAGPPGNNPTDNGATVQSALDYLRQTGMAGQKIALFGELSVTDLAKIKQATYLFGCLSIGINLPVSAVQQFNAGQPWTPVAGAAIDGGHCVMVVGYDADWIYVVTWGKVQKMSYDFWAQYVEEAWAVVSKAWVNSVTGRTPAGVNLVTLGEQFAQVTGQPDPFPAPAPAPAPQPAPPVPPAPAPAPEPPPAPSPGAWAKFWAWLESLIRRNVGDEA